MASDTLMFPVGFDLSNAVQENEIKKTLDRVEKIIKSQPLMISTSIDTAGLDHMKKAYNSTIDDIKLRVSQLNEMWSQINPSKMYNAAGDALSSEVTKFKKTIGFDDGGNRILAEEYTTVQKLYSEYEQLVSVLENYSKSLSQVHSERVRQMNEEERAIKRKAEEEKRLMQQMADEELRMLGHRVQQRIAYMEQERKAAFDSYMQRRKMYMETFSGVKGLSAGFGEGATAATDIAMQKQILRYNKLLEELQKVTAEYERYKALQLQSGGVGYEAEINNALVRRAQIQRELSSITVTADEANQQRLNAELKLNQQLERETKHNEAILALQQRLNDIKNKPHTYGAVTQIERATRAYKDQKDIVDSLNRSIVNIEQKKDTMERLGQNRSADHQKQYNDLLKERETLYGKLVVALESLYQKQQSILDIQMQNADKLARKIEQEQKAYQQQVLAITKLKAAINEQRNSRDANPSSDLSKAVVALKKQEDAANKLISTLQILNDAKDKLRATGRAKNAEDGTQTKAYTKVLERQLAVTKELAAAEADITSKYQSFCNVLRQIGLLAREQTIGFYTSNNDTNNSALDEQIRKYRSVKDAINALTADFERLKALYNESGDARYAQRMNDVLNERIAKTKELAKITQTADQAQAERLKQQEALQAKINARIDARKKKRVDEINNLRKEAAVLRRNEDTLNNINAKLEVYRAKLARTNFVQNPEEFKRIQEEIKRLLDLLDQYNAKQKKIGQSSSEARKKAVETYREHHTWLGRLIQRATLFASAGVFVGMIKKVKDITAEFELQRIALGAVIRDQSKANTLFSEIKRFALDSPLKIMDLTKYTKQLAAYRIESDKLFDTTKRLADVSVGLGVSMDRLILAYGQVRATGYLRASEVRQFTEAGLPIVELIAEQLSKMNGELVTASQVMDMISKRQVGFDQVAEAFDRMTSAGGMFYQMQEKQGNTLFGMWAKLGDAADIMYNEIGNTKGVNIAMKTFISTLRYLMLNWQKTGMVVLTVIPTLYSFWRLSRIMNGDMAKSVAIRKANTVLLEAERTKLLQKAAAERAAAGSAKLHTWAMLASNKAMIASQNATNILTRNLYALKAAFLANPWMWVVTAISAVVTVFTILQSKVSKLNSELGEINREMAKTTRESIDKFVALTRTATDEQNEGTKKQADALKELQNAYSQIIPMESLEIENLRKMKGEYAELTQLIEEYYAKQKYERKKAAIEEVYGGDIKKDLENVHQTGALSLDALGVETMIEKANELLEQGLEDTNEILIRSATEAYNDYARRLAKQGLAPEISLDKFLERVQFEHRSYWFAESPLEAYIEHQKELANALSEVQGEYDRTMNELQSYNAELDKTIAKNKELDTIVSDKGTYEDYTKNTRAMIANLEALFKTIHQSELVNMPKEVQESINTILNSNADFAEKLRKILKIEGLSGKFRAFLQNLQKEYANLVPSDFIVRGARTKFEAIAESLHANMVKMRKYLMQNNEDLKTYRKRLEDELEQLQNKLKSASFAEGVLRFFGLSESKEELEERIRVIQTMLNALPTFDKGKGGGDTRLSEATSALSELEKMYKKYKEFAKEMSENQAYQKVNDYFKETIALIKEVSNGKIDIKLPKNAEEYKNEIKKILDYIKTLPKSKKAQIEAQMKINDVDYTEAQERIEKMLKNLAQQISETKAAREFFQSIFDQSKNYDLAMSLTMSVYGDTGANYAQLLQDQIATLFGAGTDWEVDITPAINIETDTINYNNLEEIFKANKDIIPEKYWSDIQKILDEGRKFNAEQAKQWIKDLSNARTWSEKRVDLARYTQEKIKEIQSSNLSDDEKKNLIDQYKVREIREAEKLLYEAFKNTPLYVAMFNNLEAASTSALTIMRDKLVQLRTTMNNLDPTQLKEIQKRLTEIDEQLSERNMNPFKQLKDLYKEFDSKVEGSWADRLNIGSMEMGLGDNITTIQQLNDLMEKLFNTQTEKRNELNLLLAQGVSQDDKRVKTLVGELNVLEKQLHFLTGISNEYTDIQKRLKNVWKGAIKVKDGVMNVADAAYDMAEAFGASEDTLALFKDIQTSVNMIFDLTNNVTMAVGAMSKTTAEGISTVEKASIILTAISTALQVATALFNLFANAKARRLEKQIKDEQKLIDALSYSYDRLKDSSESIFGNDYINNYNKRLEQLKAMQTSYLKQADLERQKGKKKDVDKVKEYEEAARDAADQIQDMYNELANRMTGTDVASAAKTFAEAWRDAYVEFGNTANAISEKFSEMINNMVVESLMAKIVQAQLQPFFDEIDRLARDGEMTAQDIAKVVSGVPDAVRAIDDGLKVTIAQLQSAGVDIRNLNTDLEFTGIARDIASASEESINGLAAMINTQNYYISHVPMIYEEIITIRNLLSGGDMALGSNGASTIDILNLQNEYLAHLPNIASNTSLIAERCERAVAACEDIADNLGRVIKPRGTESGWVVNTNI